MAETKPKMPIRRFDVFAEYTKQKAIEDGMPEDEAEGYGLWVAKVVASRKFGATSPNQPHHKDDGDHEDEAPKEKKPKWHSLGDEPQTATMFEQEVIGRMGRTFYNTVFAPAIEDALAKGKSYTAIRDTIRKEWKP